MYMLLIDAVLNSVNGVSLCLGRKMHKGLERNTRTYKHNLPCKTSGKCMYMSAHMCVSVGV